MESNVELFTRHTKLISGYFIWYNNWEMISLCAMKHQRLYCEG